MHGSPRLLLRVSKNMHSAIAKAFCHSVLFFAICGSSTIQKAHAQTIDADILLTGGTLFDGTGSAPIKGDLAIDDGRIVAVGKFPTGDVGRSIDCEGLMIAPGFIDLHNHSDFSVTNISKGEGDPNEIPRILMDKTRESACYLTQGCTTIVTGNCGGGAVDVAAFYRALEENYPGVNVAHLLPHGSLRARVIGETRRAPTDEELAEMKQLARQAMADGAWGMSTGLQYVPGSFADTDELAEIAAVVGQGGGIYASHMRDEGDELIEAIEETIEIGRRGNLPVHISHLKASRRRNWGKVRAAATVISKARDEGHRVTADQYPYDASSTSITAMLLPDEEREGGSEATVARLNDPNQIPRLRALVEEALEARGGIMVAGCPKRPEWVGRMIREIAKDEGRSAVDVSLDILRTGDESGVSFSMDERDVRFVMTMPWAATASDGSVKIADDTKPHPRSFGTFPRRIGHFAIEEGVVPVEKAVRSASGLPADIIGLEDRGYLKSGYVADIVVFDPATFRDHATFQSPFEFSTGVKWVLLAGKFAIEDGKLAAHNAGRPLRKTSK